MHLAPRARLPRAARVGRRCLPLPNAILAEAGRRLGPQCRKRVVADRGQLKREGALLLLLRCAPLRETFVGGDPREATGLADVVRAYVENKAAQTSAS